MVFDQRPQPRVCAHQVDHEHDVKVVRGEKPSISTTSLADSVAGHLIGFSADRAMVERRVVELDGG